MKGIWCRGCHEAVHSEYRGEHDPALEFRIEGHDQFLGMPERMTTSVQITQLEQFITQPSGARPDARDDDSLLSQR